MGKITSIFPSTFARIIFKERSSAPQRGKQKPHYSKIAQEQYAGSEKAQEKKRLEKIEELMLEGAQEMSQSNLQESGEDRTRPKIKKIKPHKIQHTNVHTVNTFSTT